MSPDLTAEKEKSVKMRRNMASPAASPFARKNSSPMHTKMEVRTIWNYRQGRPSRRMPSLFVRARAGGSMMLPIRISAKWYRPKNR